MDNYTVIHVGDGKFVVELDDGVRKEAGKNLCGIIRYTYFEDYSLPKRKTSCSKCNG